jgi:hypothetical protein
MNFLGEVLSSTSELEAPRAFYYWAALSAIAAVMKDNVWVNRHIYKLYPNIYVMLHADSGLKKGPPISLAKDIVKKTGVTRIISGRSSIQGILKEIGTAESAPGGKILYGGKSIAYIVSSELTSSLVEDGAAATILTDLYDRHYNEGSWKSLLKMEHFALKDPTINMLTATNQSHSDDFFSQRDVQGGYYARTFIIYETKRNAINSLMQAPTKVPDKDALAEYLLKISHLKGEFSGLLNADNSLTPVGKFYDDWYKDFCKVIDEQSVKDSTGTINRFGDSVLKVSMLLSLARSDSMEITMEDMVEAISNCELLIGNARRTTYGKNGDKQFSIRKTLVIDELLLRSNHTISRTQLLKKYWMHGNSLEWDAVMNNFSDSGMVVMESVGDQILYIMPEKQVKQINDFMHGKNVKEE